MSHNEDELLFNNELQNEELAEAIINNNENRALTLGTAEGPVLSRVQRRQEQLQKQNKIKRIITRKKRQTADNKKGNSDEIEFVENERLTVVYEDEVKVQKQNSFMGAATISTIGIFLVRFLSLVYVIPFNAMIAGHVSATYVYTSATSMYTPFYELSLAGLPIAISYLVAQYNSREEYATSNRILIYIQRIMLALGLICMIAFIIITPFYAANRTASLNAGAEVVQRYLAQAMMFIAPALFLTPLLSGMRGYLQGYKMVLGSSISQVVEQLARIVLMLAMLYFGLNGIAKYAESAMSYAMLAIPISVLAGIICVFPFYRSVRKDHLRMIRQTRSVSHEKTKDLLSLIFRTALPFVLAGIATNLYTQVTTFTFTDTAIASGVAETVAQSQYNMIIEWLGKIVSIPLTFALAFSTTIVSFVTSAFESKDMRQVRKYTTQSYRMTLFFTLTTVIGMAALMFPLITAIYGVDFAEMMSGIGKLDSFRGLLFAMLSITTSILQALGQKNRAVIYTIIGPVIKLILNIPFVSMWGMYGDVLATMIGLSVVVLITSIKIFQISKAKPGPIIKSLFKIVVCAVPMVLAIVAVNFIFTRFLSGFDMTRLGGIIHLAIGFIIGAPVFLFLADKIGLIRETFGQEVSLRNFVQKAILKR